MNAASIRVLLVEDNPADARIIREHLRDAGGTADVIRVERVEQAVAALKQEPFDIVLLDLLLPDCVGVETVRRVYGAAPAVPIVVMSGLEDEALIAQAVDEGAQDYLIKAHVNGYLLAHSIRFAIERQRILNERFLNLSELSESLSPQRIADLERRVEKIIGLLKAGGNDRSSA